MTTTKDITYRNIAKMLVKAMPVEAEEFFDKIESYHAIIKAMPQASKIALKSAYIFSSKVPREEREDLFQDLALALLKAKTKDEKLAYAIARCDWKNWWAKYKIRQHTSLDSVTEDSEGNPVTLGELIIGECEFELKMVDKIETQRIWDKLPEKIKPIIQNRLLGIALNHHERNTLNYWTKTQGYKILLQS